MTLNADLTSSGASRVYTGTLDIDANRMTGTGHYESDPGRSERVTYECVLTNGVWSDATGEPCQIPVVIPSTRAELATAISEGTIVPSASCQHKQLCYDIAVR